jgi:hypothetical protein
MQDVVTQFLNSSTTPKSAVARLAQAATTK